MRSATDTEGTKTGGAEIGTAVRSIRNGLALTQMEFSRTLGVQRNTLSRYERGKVRPGLNVLLKLLPLAKFPRDRGALVCELKSFRDTLLLIGHTDLSEELVAPDQGCAPSEVEQ